MKYLILYQDSICIIKIGDDASIFIVFVLDMLLKKYKERLIIRYLYDASSVESMHAWI
jgi:hypothetical protein